MNGQFVISLDFEKYWGVFDSIGDENYQENIENVDKVILKLLDLSNAYNIKLTFATVGFLFNKNKESLLKNIPDIKPTYTNNLHNPYPLINTINDNQNSDTKYFAHDILLRILEENKHEIATHTYCHFYCMEDGQTLDQFEEDIKMANNVAKKMDVSLKSIVFPRNQINEDYLRICFENGIQTYRGCENHYIYAPSSRKNSKKPFYRAMRLADAYFNITGTHTYKKEELKGKGIINVPSSYFLRPYNEKLRYFEKFKLMRASNGMKSAAKNGEIFHLWFHPHNFGRNIDENFSNLESLFNTFSKMNQLYGMESNTMSEVAKKIKD